MERRKINFTTLAYQIFCDKFNETYAFGLVDAMWISHDGDVAAILQKDSSSGVSS